MAAIAESEALYAAGEGEKVVLYRLNGVDTGDTYDVSADFDEVKAAVFVPAGPLTTGVVASVAGTVITFTLPTMVDDNVYLLVIGQAA